ncbi:MAG: hypothetical protein ACTHWQ_10810 [Sphingobacterium sp.]
MKIIFTERNKNAVSGGKESPEKKHHDECVKGWIIGFCLFVVHKRSELLAQVKNFFLNITGLLKQFT